MINFNHACILFCYQNYEHIIKYHQSLLNNKIDFFILENKSDSSVKIKKYFLTQDIKHYILFDENISNNAIPIFLNEYKTNLSKYNYITFTDCDLEIPNSEDTFDEIKKNLSFKNVGVSSVDLSLENLPNTPTAKSWIPIPLNITDDYIESATGLHLSTVKQENLDIFYRPTSFLDFILFDETYKKGLKWVKTKNNKAKHLTWDLYTEDNPYYQYKLNNNVWNHNRTCKFIKII